MAYRYVHSVAVGRCCTGGYQVPFVQIVYIPSYWVPGTAYTYSVCKVHSHDILTTGKLKIFITLGYHEKPSHRSPPLPPTNPLTET